MIAPSWVAAPSRCGRAEPPAAAPRTLLPSMATAGSRLPSCATQPAMIAATHLAGTLIISTDRARPTNNPTSLKPTKTDIYGHIPNMTEPWGDVGLVEIDES